MTPGDGLASFPYPNAFAAGAEQAIGVRYARQPGLKISGTTPHGEELRRPRGQSMAENVTPRIEDVRGSGIYPATGPFPQGPAIVRSPGAFAHPEERRQTRGLHPALETAAVLAGRAIFGGYFLYCGITHFLHRKMLTDYARSTGVPAPDLAVAASGLMILAGGLSIIVGAQPTMGAPLMTTFLLGVPPQMGASRNEEDLQQRLPEMMNFTKNMALISAAMLAAAHPEPWPWPLGPRTRVAALMRVKS